MPIRQNNLLIYGLLAVSVLLAYGQVVQFDFVSYDDPDYTTGSPQVQAGLTWAGIVWAFRSGYANNSFPLTWISHMLDWQLFGAEAGGHHFTNLLLHTLTTLLLFGVLHRMTGARWRGALAAFLFGLHPLHVESVAWVAERKDVLSGLFWVLTLGSYAAYTEKGGRFRYLLTLFLFCLGLMAKPMLVTLPAVLMLLDLWPLRRGVRILEKIPFFAFAIGLSVVAYVAQQKQGATAASELIPLAVRLQNALISYSVYVLKTLWPINLAVFYPYPLESILLPAAVSGAVLIAVTVLVVRAFPHHPYLSTGWLWYLLTLLPVIGLIQVGAQARADRYTYIPMIGLSIALVWGASELLQSWPRVRTSLAIAFCAACLALTWIQVSYWKDSVSLYRHTIAAVPDSYIARFNLAVILESEGRQSEALEQFRETTRTRPGYAMAHAELGQLLGKTGHPEQGLPELQTAVRLRPDLADAHLGLGSVLGALGREDEALAEFSEAIRLEPDNANGHYNLGIALSQHGNLEGAAREFGTTVRLLPDDAEARANFGITLAQLGRLDEAILELSQALKLKPDSKQASEALDDVIKLKQQAGQQ